MAARASLENTLAPATRFHLTLGGSEAKRRYAKDAETEGETDKGKSLINNQWCPLSSLAETEGLLKHQWMLSDEGNGADKNIFVSPELPLRACLWRNCF